MRPFLLSPLIHFCLQGGFQPSLIYGYIMVKYMVIGKPNITMENHHLSYIFYQPELYKLLFNPHQ